MIEYGIPNEKKDILHRAKTIMSRLSKSVSLSKKYQQQYFRKTVNGLVELRKMFHQGYEINIENLEKLLDQVTKQSQVSQILDEPDEQTLVKIDKIFKDRQVNLEDIPNFDPTLEPTWQITSLSPPSTLLPRRMNKSDISYAILYMLLANRDDIIEVFWQTVKSLPKFKNLDVHDVITYIGDKMEDSRNEDAIHYYMFDRLKKYM